MTPDTSKLSLGDDPLVRFDLRAQFAMNRIMREIGLMAAKELQALGDPTVAPYLHSRRSRSFQSFAAHETALANLTDRQQQERLSRLKSLLASIERSKWNDYFAVVDAYHEDDDKLDDEDWRRKYGSLSYVTWLNLYFRYRAHRGALLNGMLWDFLCGATTARTADRSAVGALLVRIDDPGQGSDANQTAHREAYVFRIGDAGLTRLGETLLQTRSASRGDLRVHSKLVDIFAFGGDQRPRVLTHVLLVPVYDYYIAGEPWGGLAATLQIPLTLGPIEDHEKTIVALVNKLQSSVEVVALDLAASGMQRIAAEPTGFPLSLAFEWVRGLQYLQDWEEIRIERPDRRPLIWRRRACDHEGKKISGGLYAKLTHEQHDEPPTPSGETAPVIQFVRAIGRTDVGGERSIGEPVDIGDAMRFDDRTERGRSMKVNGVGRITFFFPPHFRLPPASSESALMSQALCDVLVRQQKELLQALASKVAARRAAVRTAVSAIMGRNLSHNIGSHVLARYGSEMRDHAYPTVENAIDPRTEFMAYLQRRMDFLAEVATADQAFWARSISLKDALARLDIEKETDLYRVRDALTGAETARAPILLSYITGKDLPATVKWGSPGGNEFPDQSFACPSGEVGIHALYVILENIIRNSARHAPPVGEGVSKQPVTVYVVPGSSAVGAASGSDTIPADLLEIQLVDPRSRWRASNEGDGEKLLTTINQILRANGDGDDHVRSEAHLLDAQGEVNPKNWGVREMQICAQFLRGLPLSELEGERADPSVLKAIPYDLGGGNWCLAYQLWLQRARDVALVYPEAAGITCAGDASARGVRLFPVRVTQGHRINWAPIVGEAAKYGIVAVAQGIIEDLEAWICADTSGSSDAGASAETVSRRHRMPMRWVEADREVLEGLAGSDNDLRCGALATLNLAVARKYLTNGDQKKGWLEDGPINLLYGIEGDDTVAESAAKLADACDSVAKHLRFTTVGINVLRGGGDRIVRETALAWMHEPSRKPGEKGLAFAWLDHGSDAFLELKKCPGFRYAGLPYPGAPRRSIWTSVESTRSAGVHRDILQRVRGTMRITPAIGADLAELVSAASARVVVLDERIQKCRGDEVGTVTLHRAWASSGIWCPRHPEDFLTDDDGDIGEFSSHDPGLACDLNSPKFDKLQAYLKAPTRLSQQWPADALVIHLTILERITKEERMTEGKNFSEGEVLKELVHGTCCETAQIVVVTGRGVPAAAWKRDGGIDARYLPISAVQEYLVSRPSKLGLMRVLWAARAPH